MVLISPLVSDLVKSVWSAPSIYIGVLASADFPNQCLLSRLYRVSFGKSAEEDTDSNFVKKVTKLEQTLACKHC